MVSNRKDSKGSKILWRSSSSLGSSSSVGMKFRPPKETPREETRGKLPCAEAASVQQVILMMFVHLCRKVIYGLDVSYRICVYILGTLMISVVSDYKTPTQNRSYFANSDNFVNQWLVKCGWFWTLLLLSGFVYITSNTYSCGKMSLVKNQVSRLVFATMVWFSITSLFNSIEAKTGMCEVTRYHRREACIASGHLWRGFDLSGHCFLLIFCNLVMHEEGKAYLGWEKIKDFIRNEEHRRVNDDSNRSDTPLSKLKNEEFLYIRSEYPVRTPLVRLLFCLMAILMILWDFMLLITVLYFHMMIEKVLASAAAVLAWFGLYKFIYKQSFSPGLPGEGLFKYVIWKDPVNNLLNKNRASCQKKSCESKWSSKDDVPKFMGMPLYGYKKEVKEEIKEDLTEEEVFHLNGLGNRRSSISLNNTGLGLRASGRKGSITDMKGRARSRSASRNKINRDVVSKNRLNHINPVHF